MWRTLARSQRLVTSFEAMFNNSPFSWGLIRSICEPMKSASNSMRSNLASPLGWGWTPPKVTKPARMSRAQPSSPFSPHQNCPEPILSFLTLCSLWCSHYFYRGGVCAELCGRPFLPLYRQDGPLVHVVRPSRAIVALALYHCVTVPSLLGDRGQCAGV
jgi:hypothetical protein